MLWLPAVSPCWDFLNFFFSIFSSLWVLIISSNTLQDWNLRPEPYKGQVLFFLIWELIDQSISNSLSRIDMCAVPLAGSGVWAEVVFAHITIVHYFRVFTVVMTEPSQTESDQKILMMIKITDLKWWTGGKIFCIRGNAEETKTSHKLLLLDCKVWSLSSKIDLCHCGLLCGWLGFFYQINFLAKLSTCTSLQQIIMERVLSFQRFNKTVQKAF